MTILETAAAFTWPISGNGYAWMIGQADDGAVPIPFLVDQSLFKSSGTRSARRYRPLEDRPTLFLDFADMDENFSDVSAFVRRFGLLGGDARAEFVSAWNGKRVRLNGEPFSTWLEQAADMRLAIELWSIAKGAAQAPKSALHESADGELYVEISGSHDTDEHSADFAMVQDECALLMSQSGPAAVVNFWKRRIANDTPLSSPSDERLLISSPNYRPERRAIVEMHGPKAAAGILVSEMINNGLKGRLGAKIAWSNGDGGEATFQFGQKPRSLLGALWLQLATAAQESRSYERCSSCESWFEVAPGLGRSDKTYCSTACRMRAYRRRKAAQEQDMAIA